jgi:hypothetical protein
MNHFSQTLLVIVSGLLWLTMVGLAAAGYWLIALYVLLPLLLVYGVLGSSHNGRFDLRLVAFPTLAWIIVWALSFALGNHYAEIFAGRHPDFTLLGFHPSFAAMIVLFWIVPTLLMGFGFEAVKDRWLSKDRWENFVRHVHEHESGPGDEEASE